MRPTHILGTLLFRCEIHPSQMQGVENVVDAGQAETGAETQATQPAEETGEVDY